VESRRLNDKTMGIAYTAKRYGVLLRKAWGWQWKTKTQCGIILWAYCERRMEHHLSNTASLVRFVLSCGNLVPARKNSVL